VLTLRRAPSLGAQAPILDDAQAAAVAHRAAAHHAVSHHAAGSRADATQGHDAGVLRVLGAPGTGKTSTAVEIVVDRVASRSALVLFETNRYSVPPGYAGQRLVLHARVGEPHLRIVTAQGIKVATHRRAPAGAEQTVRTSEHATQLERAVLDAFTTQTACRRKSNRPPGDGALAELAKLHGQSTALAPVVSLSDYAALAEVAC